jgi:hypothetical protein
MIILIFLAYSIVLLLEQYPPTTGLGKSSSDTGIVSLVGAAPNQSSVIAGQKMTG